MSKKAQQVTYLDFYGLHNDKTGRRELAAKIIEADENELAMLKQIMLCGDSLKAEHPASQPEDGGSIPTSPLSFEIRSIGHKEAKAFVESWHYSKRMPTGKNISFGLWSNDSLYAVIVYGIGVNPYQAKYLKVSSVVEIKRMCRREPKEPYELSRLIRLTAKMLGKQEKFDAVVAFADPAQGHEGTVYKAAGFCHEGMSGAEWHLVDREGNLRHRRLAFRKARREGISIEQARQSLGMTRTKTPPKHRWVLRPSQKKTKTHKGKGRKEMSKALPLVFDTETRLIGPGEVIPQLVCISLAQANEDKQIATALVAVCDDEINSTVETILDSEIIVCHNAAFDMAVLCRFRSDLISRIFRAFEEGRVHCTKIREKLLNLASHGNLSEITIGDEDDPKKITRKISYSLSAILKHRFNIDISAAKEGEDAWRVNFSLLETQPSSMWPPEAKQYAVDDSSYTHRVYEAQEMDREAMFNLLGHDPLATEDFRVFVDFCLFLQTAWGITIDAEEKAKVEAILRKELALENLGLLIENGILVPGVPPRPHKQAKGHAKDCPRDRSCTCPGVKWTAGTSDSISKKTLEEFVLRLAATDSDIKLKYNDPTEKELAAAALQGREPQGNLSLDAEWFDDHYHLNPVLEQYRHRQKLQKMVTTELPRMEWQGKTAAVVHANYDALKETGRTSSFSGDLFPSVNIQNVDPRARGCYVARPGMVLASIDYNQMELGTLAQTCVNLFGHSELGDKINKGWDTHGYLGAALAFHFDESFQARVQEQGGIEDYDQLYLFFDAMKKGSPEDKKFWKHYRTFAKPTGLGYPGGLGAKTFVQYAKATYGVIIDEAMAEKFKEVWLEVFPEMKEYFNWINKEASDPHHEGKYCYLSPLGMYRACASYCATANGKGLQTPSAEGALLGLVELTRCCYDPARESILFGCVRPVGFIHDEHLVEMPEDELMHERVDEIKRIMVESMRIITPDVEPRASAALMRRWSKEAEAVYNDQGKLMVWEPTRKE